MFMRLHRGRAASQHEVRAPSKGETATNPLTWLKIGWVTRALTTMGPCSMP